MSDEGVFWMSNEGKARANRISDEMGPCASEDVFEKAERGHADRGANETLFEPLDPAALEMLREQMMRIVGGLPKDEAEIVLYRFGVIDGQPRSIEETSRKFEVTSERVRQIESKALARRCHALIRPTLKDYLEE